MRESELLQLGVNARWLSSEKARSAYHYAQQFSNLSRYGLNERTVVNIQRLEFESHSVARAWLADRFSRVGSVQIVYGEFAVCIVGAGDFLDHWYEIFVPGRDDAVVVHNSSPEVLFYCHEEELEVGVRKSRLSARLGGQDA